MNRMKWRTGWGVALLVVLLLLPVGMVLAQDGERPQVIFTDHYLLSDGDLVDGSIIVVAQTVTLEAGSVVTGDAAFLGNAVTVQGTVQGELTALGEDIVLADGADIQGNAFVCADAIHRQTDARIGGSYEPGCEEIGSLLGQVVPAAFNASQWQWDEGEFNIAEWRAQLGVPEDLKPGEILSLSDRIFGVIGSVLLAGGMAALFTLIIPLRLRRVSDAALSAPLSTAGVGLLSLVVATGITVLVGFSLVLLITFCLVPLVGLGWVVLAVMLMLGWAAISLPFGAWFLARLGVRRVSPVAAGSVGAMLVAAVSGLLALTIWTLPLYLLLVTLLMSWGLGAAILTRFGGQTYPNPRAKMSAATRLQPELDDLPFEA